MRPFLLTLIFIASTVFAQEPPPKPVSKADVLATRAVQVFAGPDWAKARYFSYTFAVERNGNPASSFQQRWDRFTGDYRVSGVDPYGRDFVVVVNTATMKGKAWINGKPAEGKDADDMIALGLRRYNNDTFWLLMPLKLVEAGAHHAIEKQVTENGHTYDVLTTSLDNGNRSSAWVNHDTGDVEQWQMPGPKPDEPVVVMFRDFKKIGGVNIATTREIVGKNQTVHINDLVIAAEVPKDAFGNP